MALNHSAVGQEVDLGLRRWDSKDAILYALGVGAGQEDAGAELEFTTENSAGFTQKVLPSFGVMLASQEQKLNLGDFHLRQVLHAEQGLTLHAPIPTEGVARTTAVITAFLDKGEHALALYEQSITDEDTGSLLVTSTKALFLRGEGGFGGERGESSRWRPPAREPDLILNTATRQDQALLYRLSGDRNPLHADPDFARRAGFDRPILHGLCSYGVVGRALLHALCGSDPAKFRHFAVRFAAPVMPGETLTTEIWEAGDGYQFRTRVEDRIVLDRGEFSREER